MLLVTSRHDIRAEAHRLLSPTTTASPLPPILLPRRGRARPLVRALLLLLEEGAEVGDGVLQALGEEGEDAVEAVVAVFVAVGLVVCAFRG